MANQRQNIERDRQVQRDLYQELKEKYKCLGCNTVHAGDIWKDCPRNEKKAPICPKCGSVKVVPGNPAFVYA